MSLKNKFFSIITIAVGIVAFTTIGFAQDKPATTTTPDKVEKPNKGEGHGMGPRKFGRQGMAGWQGQRGGSGGMFRMLRVANLTDAQKGQIRTILQSNRPDKATFDELRTIREARLVGTAITPEQKERIKAIREQARTKGESVHQQILGVLTAEQKAQIETRKQQMKQRFEQHKQMRQQKPATTEKPKVN